MSEMNTSGAGLPWPALRPADEGFVRGEARPRGGMRQPGSRGPRVQVRAQFVARNAGDSLDVEHALSGDAAAAPLANRRLA